MAINPRRKEIKKGRPCTIRMEKFPNNRETLLKIAYPTIHSPYRVLKWNRGTLLHSICDTQIRPIKENTIGEPPTLILFGAIKAKKAFVRVPENAAIRNNFH